MVYWRRPFFHPAYTHPPPSIPEPTALCAKGRGEDGGGEGKQSQAEPCLTPEEKKNKGGGRRGAKRNRRAEKKYLKTGRMKNRSHRRCCRDSRRGTGDHSKALLSPVVAQNWKQDYLMLLIIETHAASDRDFQRWVCGNTHLIWVYSTVQSKTCQTSWLGSHGPGHSHGLGSVLHHHLHQTRLAATWTLGFVRGSLLYTPFGPALCRLRCWWNTAASSNPTGWAGSEWEVKRANSIMGAKQWNGMNEIPQLPVSFFFPVSIFHSIPFQTSQEIRFILLYHLLDCNMCYYMWLYMNIITLPLNVCLNCAYKIDVWVLPAIVKSPSNRESLASIWSEPSACSVDAQIYESTIHTLMCWQLYGVLIHSTS